MSIKCLCDQTVGYTCESCEFERLEASIKNLQTENAKLRECIEFYADTNNWDAADGVHDSIISGVITGADHYEPWGETGIAVGGKRAIECLKELDKK